MVVSGNNLWHLLAPDPLKFDLFDNFGKSKTLDKILA